MNSERDDTQPLPMIAYDDFMAALPLPVIEVEEYILLFDAQ